MSDQDTKPLEASTVAAPVESTEAAPATEPVVVSEEASVKAENDKPATTTEEAGAKTEDDKPVAETNGNKTSEVSVLNPPKNMLRVKRDFGAQDGNTKANKFDPTVLEETSDPVLIRSQVHFYFSDSNLASDKFMREQTGGTENKAIPLTTITSFKRMRRFQPQSAVITALKESNFIVIEGEEGKETIRRQKAWDPTKATKLEERSIYVKGFGNEIPSTQFDIEAFFTQYGEIHSVRLRRGDDGGFKGSVFVEWADQETAEKFMALDPKPTWKEHDLLIMWKAEYTKQKNDAIREGKIQPKNNHGKPFHRGRGRGGFRGTQRDGADANDWKKRRDVDQKRGFAERRDSHDQRGRGRGRGRGGRGRGDHRGGRGRDQAEEQSEKKESAKATNENGELPAPKINIGADTNGKRARDDDAEKDRPAKKVDTKESAAETS
ncbi:La domain-containing protein [Apiospora phragmitis]|uniref:La domain-containing protein n=1 Tax=Apiospora phragmitis TaxID=2905665 RepID=A0ABR1X6A8_9PEZI